MEFKKKIRVFISSNCCHDRDKKISILRSSIKTLLESTGLFSVYLFESTGSSEEVINAYLKELAQSNICLFIILNDKIPPGVINEIKLAKEKNISRIYFVKDYDNNQNSSFLRGFDSKHCASFDYFDEIPKKLLEILSNEIYNKFDDSFDSYISENNSLTNYENLEYSDSDCFDINSTSFNDFVNFFTQLFFSENFVESKTNFVTFEIKDIYDCAKVFLLSSLGYHNISKMEINKIAKQISNMHKEKQREFFEKRIKNCLTLFFFRSNETVNNSLKILEELFEQCDINSNWLENDLLIDLRHVCYLKNENDFSINKYQTIIDKQKRKILYPEIDRIDSNIAKEVQDDYFRLIVTDSYYTVNFNNWSYRYGQKFVNRLLIALFNGSYIQLRWFFATCFSYICKAIPENEFNNGLLLNCAKFAILSPQNNDIKILAFVFQRLVNLKENDYLDLLKLAKCSKESVSSLKLSWKILSNISRFISNEALSRQYCILNDDTENYCTNIQLNFDLIVEQLKWFKGNINRIAYSEFDTILAKIIPQNNIVILNEISQILFEKNWKNEKLNQFQKSNLKTVLELIYKNSVGDFLDCCRLIRENVNYKTLVEEILEKVEIGEEKVFVEFDDEFSYEYWENLKEFYDRIIDDKNYKNNINIDLYFIYITNHLNKIKNFEDDIQESLNFANKILLDKEREYTNKLSILKFLLNLYLNNIKKNEIKEIIKNENILKSEAFFGSFNNSRLQEITFFRALMIDLLNDTSINTLELISSSFYKEAREYYIRAASKFVRISKNYVINEKLLLVLTQFFTEFCYDSRDVFKEYASLFFLYGLQYPLIKELSIKSLLKLSEINLTNIHRNCIDSLKTGKIEDSNFYNCILENCKKNNDYELKQYIEQSELKIINIS